MAGSKSKLSPAPRKTAPIKANRATVSDSCGPRSTEKSVEIRKIENGYIVRESTYGGKGGYKSTERFTEKPPTIQIAPTKSRK
jgi:hypothetical protein